MVRAILEGRKTETRRIVKPQPGEAWHDIKCAYYTPGVIDSHGELQPGKMMFLVLQMKMKGGRFLGAPSNYLWVREAFYKDEVDGVYYKADADEYEDYDPKEWRWKPSIHMPRHACRLLLQVEDIGVQRLQEITRAGIEAEGFSSMEDFIELWNALHKKDGWVFNKNPWVWVIKFKQVHAIKL